MRSKPAFVLISIAVVAVAACTGSAAAPSEATSTVNQAAPAPSQVAVASLTATTAPVSSPSDSPTPAASAAPEPSPSADAGTQATPSPIDPCSLLTADEASKAIGKKLSAGVSTLVDKDRECTFKSGLTEVKVIVAPPAPDAATAQAYWDKARSEIPAGVPVKDVTGFDRAAYGSGSAGGASLSALFVIDGTTFFDLYCGFPMCSQAASVAAARLIVGRLP
ncbi:MAG TPA: hypothetical protein VIU37_00285 [Candidatus Limnocylindrales bacterium]